MKKVILILVSIIFLYGCSKDETNSQNPGEIIELKTLSVNIELPNNSTISESDLTVSSLFSESIPISNGTSEIESFDDDSMELTFATNQQGNIVMLSYYNPLNNEIVEMNSESTATALVLLHPWSFDLTVNAKAEAIEFIKGLPEFDSYKLEIENSLASGELNPLNSQSVLEKVTEIQQITFSRTTEYIEPLEFNIENSTASVKNVLSSATYSIGLYDENDVLFEHKPAQGLDKSHFLFQEFKNNVFQQSNSEQQTATFNIPTDGNWTLKAKSGLSFDGSLENQQAAYYNTKTIVANVIGIFSTKLKSLMVNNDCLVSVGELVYNGASGSIDISSSIQSYSNGSLSGYGLTKNVSSFILDRFDDVFNFIEECTAGILNGSDLDKLKSGPFGKILGFLNILSNLENVFNSTAMLTDWVQYDKEIEFCFNKNGDEIQECGIFSTWNISITDTCTDSQGNVSNSETYNGQIILNEDYTVTYVGQDNSNTVSNSFSFTNNTLVIETAYNDFSITTPCNGQDSQLVNDTQTMQYDESNDSFSGTTLTTTPEINGVDENGNACIIEGRTCNGTVTLTR